MTLHIGILFNWPERACDSTGFHPWGCCDGSKLERAGIDGCRPEDVVTFQSRKRILHGEHFKLLTKTGRLKWL